MSCNSIVCGVFEVDFEMAVVGIKVPLSLLQRGIRKGTVTVDFGDVIGPPKTAEAVEAQPSTAPNTAMVEIAARDVLKAFDLGYGKNSTLAAVERLREALQLRQ